MSTNLISNLYYYLVRLSTARKLQNSRSICVRDSGTVRLTGRNCQVGKHGCGPSIRCYCATSQLNNKGLGTIRDTPALGFSLTITRALLAIAEFEYAN